MALKMIINALAVMLNGLMSPRDTTKHFVERHVKIFLSACNRFAKSYYDSTITPFWATTSSFPSLLNLASQVEHHAQLRWYWDGTRERYIQSVKKILKNMRKSGTYFAKKMIMIMQKMSVVVWFKKQVSGWNEERGVV